MYKVRVAAFCLIPSHYHLLIQTPGGDLARCMRHLNGIYTQRFNRVHHCDGQLFRGRYKSILVDADSYLLELVTQVLHPFTLCERQKRRDKYLQKVYFNGKPGGDKPHFFTEQVPVYVGQ